MKQLPTLLLLSVCLFFACDKFVPTPVNNISNPPSGYVPLPQVVLDRLTQNQNSDLYWYCDIKDDTISFVGYSSYSYVGQSKPDSIYFRHAVIDSEARAIYKAIWFDQNKDSLMLKTWIVNMAHGFDKVLQYGQSIPPSDHIYFYYRLDSLAKM